MITTSAPFLACFVHVDTRFAKFITNQYTLNTPVSVFNTSHEEENHSNEVEC